MGFALGMFERTVFPNRNRGPLRGPWGLARRPSRDAILMVSRNNRS